MEINNVVGVVYRQSTKVFNGRWCHFCSFDSSPNNWAGKEMPPGVPHPAGGAFYEWTRTIYLASVVRYKSLVSVIGVPQWRTPFINRAGKSDYFRPIRPARIIIYIFHNWLRYQRQCSPAKRVPFRFVNPLHIGRDFHSICRRTHTPARFQDVLLIIFI